MNRRLDRMGFAFRLGSTLSSWLTSSVFGWAYVGLRLWAVFTVFSTVAKFACPMFWLSGVFLINSNYAQEYKECFFFPCSYFLFALGDGGLRENKQCFLAVEFLREGGHLEGENIATIPRTCPSIFRSLCLVAQYN